MICIEVGLVSKFLIKADAHIYNLTHILIFFY